MKTFFFHDFIFNECYIVKSNHCACSQLHKRSSLYYACLIRSIFTLSMLISLCLVYNILRKYILVYSCNCDIGIKTLCLRMCYTYFVFVNIFCSQIVSNTCIISWIEIFRTFDWHMNYFKRYEFSITEKQEWWTEPNSRRAFNSRGSEWCWGWPFELNGQCLMGEILHYGENGVACWTRPLQYLCLSDIFVCGSLSRIQNESKIVLGKYLVTEFAFIYYYKPVTFSVNSVELLGFSTSDELNKSDFHLFFMNIFVELIIWILNLHGNTVTTTIVSLNLGYCLKIVYGDVIVTPLFLLNTGYIQLILIFFCMHLIRVWVTCSYNAV